MAIKIYKKTNRVAIKIYKKTNRVTTLLTAYISMATRENQMNHNPATFRPQKRPPPYIRADCANPVAYNFTDIPLTRDEKLDFIDGTFEGVIRVKHLHDNTVVLVAFEEEENRSQALANPLLWDGVPIPTIPVYGLQSKLPFPRKHAYGGPYGKGQG